MNHYNWPEVLAMLKVMASNQVAYNGGDENFYLPTTFKDFKLVCQTLAKYAEYVFGAGR